MADKKDKKIKKKKKKKNKGYERPVTNPLIRCYSNI